MTSAFQRNAFQLDSFQSGEYAFQQCAFSSLAFQAAVCVSGCGYDSGNTYDSEYEYDAVACPIAVGTCGYDSGNTYDTSYSYDTTTCPVVVPTLSGGRPIAVGGGHYDAGRGYIKTEHGWYRATKYARTGAAAMRHMFTPRFRGEIGTAKTSAQAFKIEASTISKTYGSIGATLCRAYSSSCEVSSGAEVGYVTTSAFAETHKVDWLDADELVAILEEMEC